MRFQALIFAKDDLFVFKYENLSSRLLNHERINHRFKGINHEFLIPKSTAKSEKNLKIKLSKTENL